ncbi:MAG: hypothetical protein ACO23H_16900 [Alphaproteobacteria bacterium]
MFSTHQKAISEFALSSNVGLERTFRLVFLSIRQPFHSMAKQMQDVDDNGMQSPYLFGWKRSGLAFVRANASTLRETLKAVPNGYGEAQALLEVATVPGLGLVKAGFVLQLVTGSAGCIDSHNMQRFGLNVNAFKYGSNASDALKRKKALAYLDACWKAGGCESLWNGWCDYVAAQQPKHWTNGFDVSAMHETAILGEY